MVRNKIFGMYLRFNLGERKKMVHYHCNLEARKMVRILKLRNGKYGSLGAKATDIFCVCTNQGSCYIISITAFGDGLIKCLSGEECNQYVFSCFVNDEDIAEGVCSSTSLARDRREASS